MLLEAQERRLCEQIAAGQPPYSQRAHSLLALDAGSTQSAAAQESGLTIGQVKYWLRKFRKSRMDMFPEELLPQSEPEIPPSGQLPVEPIALEALELDQPVKQDTAAEKANSAPAEAERAKKGKAKAKKKSKKTKTTKKAKKKKSKSGKKRKQKKDKRGKKKQGKKKPAGKKARKKKKGKK